MPIDWTEIAKRYPMREGAVPGRPWWQYAPVRGPECSYSTRFRRRT